MRLAAVEALVGVPYCEDTFDCADFVVLVQQQLFGRAVQLPGSRPRGIAGQAAIGELSRPYGSAVAVPADGDLVLMVEHGQRRAGHAGVYFYLAHEGWVLHSNEKNRCSVLHRIRDLPDFGLRIEGYYRWA